MEDLTMQIDRFLNGEMTDEEKCNFEKKIAEDESLRKEVDLQLKTGALLETAAWIETKNKVEALNVRKTKLISLKPLLKIASIAILLLGSTYFFMHSNYSDKSLYQKYASPYPDYLTVMGEGTDELNKAMNLYKEEKYAEAEVLFKNISKKDSSNFDKVLLYRLTCLIETGRSNEAIFLVEKNRPDAYTPSIEWQLILAYLADGRSDDLVDFLTTFRKNNNGYQDKKAEELLNDLNSFWR